MTGSAPHSSQPTVEQVLCGICGWSGSPMGACPGLEDVGQGSSLRFPGQGQGLAFPRSSPSPVSVKGLWGRQGGVWLALLTLWSPRAQSTANSLVVWATWAGSLGCRALGEALRACEPWESGTRC